MLDKISSLLGEVDKLIAEKEMEKCSKLLGRCESKNAESRNKNSDIDPSLYKEFESIKESIIV